MARRQSKTIVGFEGVQECIQCVKPAVGSSARAPVYEVQFLRLPYYFIY